MGDVGVRKWKLVSENKMETLQIVRICRNTFEYAFADCVSFLKAFLISKHFKCPSKLS